MTQLLRRTPCVGICSTTYGDLVCRGCKRYAHEIVLWNSFSADQRQRVLTRLAEIRDGCTAQVLIFEDSECLRGVCERRGLLGKGDLSDASLAYELLRTALNDAQVLPEAKVELRERVCGILAEDLLAALSAIEALFLSRSQAHYERAFKTPIN